MYDHALKQLLFTTYVDERAGYPKTAALAIHFKVNPESLPPDVQDYMQRRKITPEHASIMAEAYLKRVTQQQSQASQAWTAWL
jgi:hypothetical protein